MHCCQRRLTVSEKIVVCELYVWTSNLFIRCAGVWLEEKLYYKGHLVSAKVNDNGMGIRMRYLSSPASSGAPGPRGTIQGHHHQRG